ncbi:FtsX-like permease family protein [Paenibacillus sp.]|uniref:FtsX-like permease family protein n=1 Tax=Paenibacillus sp. TaxID=58172 RepID=UPI002D38DBD4|nr:FtsX-like permease family protein [Paenibacillus sp.]HZG84231.1 FtsX-like permease family protein [Paenibacillus sp.]
MMSTAAVAVAAAVAGALLLYLAHSLVRYPHVRRMAWRNVWSHRQTSLLTALGLAVSTALITMTLAASASLQRTIEQDMERHFGPIAYDMASTDQRLLEGSYFRDEDIRLATERSRGRALPVAAAVFTMLVKNEAGERLLAVPNLYALGVDRGEAVRFDPSLAELWKTAPGTGEAVLSVGAAEALDVRAGDTVHVLDASNREHALTVADIVPERGVTGYRGVAGARATVLLHPDTVRALLGAEEGAYTNVLLTEPPSIGWQAAPVREDAARTFRDAAQFITVIFGMTSSNAVLIGIVLITNIFKMVAEERRQEMGILRAIGLGRKELKKLLRTEGLIYGFTASVIGVAAGTALAYVLTVSVSRTMVESFSGNASDGFGFAVVPGALLAGFAIGLSIVFGCVWAISRKAVRFSIVEALQTPAAPERERRRSSLAQLWLLVASGVAAGALVIVTAIPDIRREWVNEDAVALVMLTTLLSVPLFVLLFMQCLRWLCDALLLPFRSLPAPTFLLRTAFRNLNANPLRTGLLMLMFAAISCFVSFPLVYNGALEVMLSKSDPREAAGGFDLLARDQRALSTEEMERGLLASGEVDDGSGFRLAAVTQLLWKKEVGEWGPFLFKANGVDAAFAEINDVELRRRDERFASDRDAWLELTRNKEAIIVSEDALVYVRSGMFEIGDEFPVRIGDRSAAKRIIAVAETTGYHPESFGLWMHREALADLAKQPEELHSTVLVKLERPDPELEKSIERGLTLQNVADVINIVESETGYYRAGEYLIRMFLRFNQFALAIGMIGLTVVMYRLVRQRQQQIGMLRAVGVSAGQAFWMLLLEGAFIGGFGIVIGFTIGTYMSYIIFDTLMSGDLGQSLTLPLGTLAVYFFGTLGAALAFASLPARKVLRIPPSEATRYVG